MFILKEYHLKFFVSNLAQQNVLVYYVGMENFEMNMESIQEGEEWIARLQSEADSLLLDIVAAENILSPAGVNVLRYAYMQTENTINSIKMEIMYFGGEDL
jgi:hypothetical protein